MGFYSAAKMRVLSLKLAAKNIPRVCSLYNYRDQMCSATDLTPALCKILTSVSQVISLSKHQSRVSGSEDVILH